MTGLKRHTYTHTCPPVSDDEEEWVISHDLRVKHQSPGEGYHSYRKERERDREKEREKERGRGRERKEQEIEF